MLNPKKVLVLAPHTDDGELGCGGTIARLIADGVDVHYMAFSICEESVPEPYPKDILAQEVAGATQSLGIAADNLEVLRYPVRRLDAHRQTILEQLIVKDRELRPDVVFMPATDDIHQDHQTINGEAKRAFKRTTLLGYELPWNSFQFNGRAFFSLEETHVASKVAALAEYESQQHRPYMRGEAIEMLARTRGFQAGCALAEAFEVVRWIWR